MIEIEAAMPQVLKDLIAAYGNSIPTEPDRVKELRQMRKNDTARFHALLQKYQEQWDATKAKVETIDEDNLDACDILVGKLIDDFVAKRASEKPG